MGVVGVILPLILLVVVGEVSALQNATCPSGCSCESISLTKYFRIFLGENSEKMGQGSRLEIQWVKDFALKMMEENVFLKLVSRLQVMVNMTCHVRDNNRSLDGLLGDAPGLLLLGTFVCGNNLTIQFDQMPLKFVLALKISGCHINSSQGIFTFPLFNTLFELTIDHVNSEWLEIVDLSNLNFLWALKINNNRLKKLPSIWANTTLNRMSLLDLSGNGISEFDCRFGWGSPFLFPMYKSIDTINLEDNNLSEIPRCLLEKKELIPYISLARNKIKNTTIFKDINSYIGTHSLNLKENEINSLSYVTFLNMSSLDLSRNAIKSIKITSFRSFKEFSPLNMLNLSHNQIDYIEYGSLDFTPLLKYLDLSYNHIRSFDFEFSPLYNFNITIDLRFNDFRYPPFQNTGYLGPRSIQTLSANNPFYCDCTMVEFVSLYRELKRSFNRTRRERLYSASRPFFDVKNYICAYPNRLENKYVTGLNTDTDHCPIVYECPVNCTCERYSDFTSIDCHNKSHSISQLPESFPAGKQLKINLAGNRIKEVTYRQYLDNTTELDLSSNTIVNITLTGAEQLLRIPVVRLERNSLNRLPSSLKTFKNISTNSITLSDNPWECSCDTVWLQAWMKHLGERLVDRHYVLCRGGEFDGLKVLEINADELNCQEDSHIVSSIVMGVCLVVVLSAAILVIVFRQEIAILLYSRFRWSFLKRDVFPKDLPYDVFVSFSQADYQWVVHTLTPALENREAPYKLCLHFRDFPVGAPIAESIVEAIADSRCTLMFVTNNFLNSEWCMYEFKTAHQQLFEDKRSKVLMILNDEVDSKNMDKTLRAYVRTHTYIQLSDRIFWKKLEYALPKQRSKDTANANQQ